MPYCTFVLGGFADCCASVVNFLFFWAQQAIKALKEEGVEVILMNPNIASVQTNTDNKSPHKADQVPCGREKKFSSTVPRKASGCASDKWQV